MKTKRALSMLLLTAVFAAGCEDTSSQQNPTHYVTESDDAIQAVTEPEEVKVIDDLPADLDFKGRELRILTTENTYSSPLLVEESTGDVLDDAKYERNAKVMERFGITMTEELEMWIDATEKARNTILSGDDAYDLISLIDREALTFASEGMLWSADEVENIDLSKPYWNQYLNSCLTLGKKQILAYSDICMTTYDFTHVLLFNQQLVEDLKLISPYDLVEDGSWTIDKFGEYALAATDDLNGDTQMDKSDRYGFAAYPKQVSPCFWIASGCVSIEKNDDDLPEFTMANERMLSVIQKAYDISWGGSAWYIQASSDYTANTELFTNGQALFADAALSTPFGAEYRNMKDDYGIIPYPKYDETQTSYYSRVEGGCPYFIPVTIEDTCFAGAMMESLACESYNSVIPVYYEIALKAKYVRDSQSAKVLDLIMENRVYDWGDTFFTNYIRDGFVWYKFAEGKLVAASDIESNRTAVEGAIKNIVDKLS